MQGSRMPVAATGYWVWPKLRVRTERDVFWLAACFGSGAGAAPGCHDDLGRQVLRISARRGYCRPWRLLAGNYACWEPLILIGGTSRFVDGPRECSRLARADR